MENIIEISENRDSSPNVGELSPIFRLNFNQKISHFEMNAFEGAINLDDSPTRIFEKHIEELEKDQINLDVSIENQAVNIDNNSYEFPSLSNHQKIFKITQVN